MVEMRLSIEGLEKERDFYFGKLRDIEVVIQESADAADPMATKVLEVLYATEVILSQLSVLKTFPARKILLLQNCTSKNVHF